MSLPNTALVCQSENYPPEDQLELFDPFLYHDQTSFGFFSLCQKSNGTLYQRSHRLSDLAYVLKAVDRKKDTYLSQGEFCRPNRRVVNLARLGLCFIDLDSYNTKWKDHTHEQIVGAILQHCNDEAIPEPMILSSGRGFYLKWIFERAIPDKVLPRWNALQSSLCNVFQSFGADPGAKDASRILRLENTVNTKNGEVCKVLHTAPAHDFEGLCREMLPHDRHEIRITKQTKAATKLTLIQGGGKVIPGLRRLGIMSLHWARIRDLKTLAALRNGIKDGDRDRWMFAAVCSLAWIIAPGQLYHEVLAMCRYACPTMPKEAIFNYSSSAIGRAELSAKGNEQRYKMSNRYLIDWLSITPFEQTHLSTIISQEEAKDRDRQRHRKYADRQTYLQPADERRIEARLRAARGESQREIAEALGCSRGAIRNYLTERS